MNITVMFRQPINRRRLGSVVNEFLILGANRRDAER
jgi:hypothetical protein